MITGQIKTQIDQIWDTFWKERFFKGMANLQRLLASDESDQSDRSDRSDQSDQSDSKKKGGLQ
ncbi:MAG: hypothetical protein NC095_11015 [Muribaculum sp.]|nr:hypothetical protein [Muribaculum sp.]